MSGDCLALSVLATLADLLNAMLYTSNQALAFS